MRWLLTVGAASTLTLGLVAMPGGPAQAGPSEATASAPAAKSKAIRQACMRLAYRDGTTCWKLGKKFGGRCNVNLVGDYAYSGHRKSGTPQAVFTCRAFSNPFRTWYEWHIVQVYYG